MIDYPFTTTLRDLDQQAGLPKGSAFRAFKAIEEQLIEGIDYRLLNHDADTAEIAELKRNRRIYPSSLNVLLFAKATHQQLLAVLIKPSAGTIRSSQQ